MIRLLKTDFKRFFKDKLFLVACIIASAFAIITPLLYKVIFDVLDMDLSEMGLVFDVKTMFFSAFSLTNNLGLIAPIFIMIIISKDFSFGTIRNKIIKGHSRAKIFISLFIVSASILSLIMFSYAAINGLLTLALFSNLVNEVTVKEVGYFILSLLFELLVMICIAALMSFLATYMKNAGLAIVLYAALLLGLTAVSGIVQVAIVFVESEALANTIKTLSLLNVFANTSVIGMGTSYKLIDALIISMSSLIFTIGLLALGIVGFNKKDLK